MHAYNKNKSNFISYYNRQILLQKSDRDNRRPADHLGPIFSDSSYKNRLVANFSALEDLFWQKFWTLSISL
jgi:hypothetical protein